jgi:hypothetical protein
MATYVIYSKQDKRYYVTDDYSRAFYPCSERRLGDAVASQGIKVKIRQLRSPRKGIISRGNGRKIEVDRLWDLTKGLQETAEIIHRLQKLDRGGKIKLYKELGL